MTQPPNLFTERQRYLSKQEVATRYSRTVNGITYLLNHRDITRRMPPPSLVMGNVPYWSVDDLDRFDVEQIELSKTRQIRRPGPKRRASSYRDEEA